MVQELDASFDAVLFIGYHSKAGAETNPLAHTLTTGVASIKLNGTPASEFLLHSYAAALFDVPAAFVSGDQGLCDDVAAFHPGIKTLAVSQGIGPSTVGRRRSAMQPDPRRRHAALTGEFRAAAAAARSFTLDVTFVSPTAQGIWYRACGMSADRRCGWTQITSRCCGRYNHPYSPFSGAHVCGDSGAAGGPGRRRSIASRRTI
jgi:D-amino peptidase